MCFFSKKVIFRLSLFDSVILTEIIFGVVFGVSCSTIYLVLVYHYYIPNSSIFKSLSSSSVRGLTQSSVYPEISPRSFNKL